MTFTDIIIPTMPEHKYLEILQRLGTKQAIFLYEKNNKKTFETLQKKYDIKIRTGLINSKQQHPLNITKGTRHNVDRYKYKLHSDFEHLNKKDSMHYRKSGMNQVIGKIMKEKNKTYIINHSKITTSKNPHIILGKIILNLKIARKYGFNVAIASMAKKPKHLRSKEQLKSMIAMLGYHKIANQSTKTIHNYLQER